MMTRILIIGNGADDKYIGNCLRECRKCDTDLVFDFFNTNLEETSSFRSEVNQYVTVKRHRPNWIYNIPKVRGYFNQLDLCISLRDFIGVCQNENIYYDVCQIHFLNPIYAKIADRLKKISRKVVITPWGSDVLRAKKYQLRGLRKLVQKSNWVTCTQGSRFEKDIVTLLDIPKEKLYNLPIGIASIDEILSRPFITDEQAKRVWGFEGKYVIVIGYKGSPAHNHIKVIKSLVFMKKQLPTNTILVCPMTYGGNPVYRKKIKRLLWNSQFENQILENYLTAEELVCLRKATDLFIHAQNTDANSGTIAEYLLCRKKIVNPTWITYPHYETYGSPFYSFSNFEELPQAIMKAINDTSNKVSPLLTGNISESGWSKLACKWVELYKKY